MTTMSMWRPDMVRFIDNNFILVFRNVVSAFVLYQSTFT